MPTIKYSIGQERDFYIEKEDFDNSIFSSQYKNALRLFNHFLNSRELEKKTLKNIAFCGDRGDGKTSCMMSVVDIIKHSQDKSGIYKDYLNSLGLPNIVNDKTKIYFTDMVDPSFFDEGHKVLEIIIGHLYSRFQAEKEKRTDVSYEQRNELQKAFIEVKNCLCILFNKDMNVIDELHELTVLSKSIDLQKCMGNLVKRFLKFMGCKVLVIPIDDVDLNMGNAYDMCEQIRKYLCVPNCLVLMAVKISQLSDVIVRSYKEIMRVGVNSDFEEMAKKYLNKLIPVSSRIDMPKPFSLENIKIEIDYMDGADPYVKNLQEAVVELIFFRTRYLFYNSLQGVSPIVPNNLRELLNLVGLLASMPVVPDSKSDYAKLPLHSNQTQFKNYFFTVWKERFDGFEQDQLDRLINFDFGTSFNNEVVKIIKIKFASQLSKDYSRWGVDEAQEGSTYEDKERLLQRQEIVSKFYSTTLSSIISTDNFSYNISIGDAMYLLSSLESEIQNESDYALIFFLKSLYSIKLYEAYDYITEQIGAVYPEIEQDKRGLSTVDHRFNHTNRLQQLVGGNYFTYCPGEFLAMPASQNFDIDLRIISGDLLNKLISEVKVSFDGIIQLAGKENKTEDETQTIARFDLKLQLVEFFILTIRCAIRQKELRDGHDNIPEILSSLRKNVDPFNYRKYNSNTGYYLFDALMPFTNLINPRYAYRKFDLVDDEFYDKIRNYEGSLLNAVMQKCAEKSTDAHFNHIDAEWSQIHKMQTVAVIRNAEVLSAIADNMRYERATNKLASTLILLYEHLKESKMKTQPTGPDAAPYDITFEYLNPIIDFLRIAHTKGVSPIQDEINKIFVEVFDGYQIKKGKNKKQSSDKIIKYLRDIVGNRKKPAEIRNVLKGCDLFRNINEDFTEFFPDRDDNYFKADKEPIFAAIAKKYHNLEIKIAGEAARENPDNQNDNEGNNQNPVNNQANQDEVPEEEAERIHEYQQQLPQGAEE